MTLWGFYGVDMDSVDSFCQPLSRSARMKVTQQRNGEANGDTGEGSVFRSKDDSEFR